MNSGPDKNTEFKRRQIVKGELKNSTEIEVFSAAKRIGYALGSMFLIILVLVAAIFIFVSFGKGVSINRAIAGLVITFVTLFLFWKSISARNSVISTFMAIFSGMGTWMVTAEIAVHFGFAKIEAEEGLVLLFFLTAFTAILWIKKIIPWPVKVFLTSYLLNWWGHAILLTQLFIASEYNMPVFETTYFYSGILCILAFVFIIVFLLLKPVLKSRLIFLGLWLYFLLVTGIEGITRITERSFGH